MKLLLVAAASLAVVSCASLSMEDQEFHAWKLKFGKVYRSPEEEARRKDIWLSTRRTVLAHNILADQGIKTYRMGMNHLSDMDEHDYKTLYGSLLPEDLNSTGKCDKISSKPGATLPQSVNWTDQGCVTPVKNQGQCGSCWAFSAVGALESHTCIKHKLKAPIPLSEQQLVDCSWSYGNEGCDGGLAVNTFEYCMDKKEIITEKFYQYAAKAFPCPFNKKAIPKYMIGARCSGCHVLAGDEPSLQRAVAEIGPVYISIPVHPSFKKYTSGIYYEPNCHKPPPNNLHHAMLVVGYGAENGQNYWLVKNSWGGSWGERGYIKMARDGKNHCGIATQAVYPVVK